MDADLVLVDPGRRWTVTRDGLFDRHRASPFVDRELSGQVMRTLVRGRTVFTHDRGVVSDAGGGHVSADLSPAGVSRAR